MAYKRLTRSKDNRMLAGICGGIAAYFDIDPTIVRLGFVVLLFCTALLPCLIAYGLGLFIIPEN